MMALSQHYKKTGRVYQRIGNQQEFTYSDGDHTEETLLKIVKEADDLSIASLYWEQHITDWPTLYHLSPKRADLLRPFKSFLKNKSVLELGAGCGAITRFLGEADAVVTSVEGNSRRAAITAERCRDLPNVTVVCDNIDEFKTEELYDLIILVGVLEYSYEFIDEKRPDLSLLKALRAKLSHGGTLILAIENKLGLKYWGGAPEDHVGEPYVGLENSYDKQGPRTYGKHELEILLHEAGYFRTEFMFPFPDYKLPSIILREKAVAGDLPGLDNILVPAIEAPAHRNFVPTFASERVMNEIVENRLVAELANSFLITAGVGDGHQVLPEKSLGYIYSSGRMPVFRKENIIEQKTGSIIVKRAVINPGLYSPEGAMIKQVLIDEPYESGRLVFLDFLEILTKQGWSVELLQAWFKPFYQFVQKYAAQEDANLISGNLLDLTPINVLVDNTGNYKMFDQEWQTGDPVPIRYVLFRGLYFCFARPVYIRAPESGTPMNAFALIGKIFDGIGLESQGASEEFQALESRYFSAVSPRGDYQPVDISMVVLPGGSTGNISAGDIFPDPLKSLTIAVSCMQKKNIISDSSQLTTSFFLSAEQTSESIHLDSVRDCTELKVSFKNGPGTFRFYSYQLITDSGKIINSADFSSAQPLRITDVIPVAGEHSGYQLFLLLAGEPALHITIPEDVMISEGERLHLRITVAAADDPEVKALSKSLHHLLLIDAVTTEDTGGHARNQLAAITQRISHHVRADLEAKIAVLRDEIEKIENTQIVRELTVQNEQLQKTLDWYIDTYENRSFAGIAKTKLKTRFKSIYERSLRRLISTNLVQERYVLKYLLEYTRDNGAGYSLRNLNMVIKKNGLFGTLKNARRLTLTAIQKDAAAKSPVPTIVEPDDLLTVMDMLEKIRGFKIQPLVSVIIPTYNTNPVLLKQAVGSVLDQVYTNWELCIADDGSTKAETISAIKEYAGDPRIKIRLLETNGGISSASNEAIALSSGEYLALFDHDDEITPDALFWMIHELNEHPEADILYSDECQKDEEGNKSNYFLKPDWSPQLLLNMMYVGHLTMYKKSFLTDKVGLFRSEYDFSQDYDLILRATEQTINIRHIPKVLYYWRQTAGSASVGEKPYARQSNIRALEDAMKRRDIPARVIELPTANRVQIFPYPNDFVSIIIPTDSYDNLKATIDSIAENTSYANYEIVPVTNSGLISRLSGVYPGLRINFVAYDKPYNFSDKCNAGAAGCNGDIVIFLNDDVRPLQKDWIENTIEYLTMPGVGGVSPKLIYEDDTIQYAGMVTGVRNLTGTSFHCYPRNSTAYINFPQLTREVSILSGACLAMKKTLFERVGGFDAVNTPSAHSDVDLSFKIIEAGFTCVYTPYAELRHIGHLSLAVHEKKDKVPKKDKADIFLLQRWPAYVSRDPWFTSSMRNLLYHDSPEPISIYPGFKRPYNQHAKNVILVCHDLSRSGAPIMVYNIAKVLMNNGFFAVVFCTKDGPLREAYQQAGITVIIDPLILNNHLSFEKFAINFDFIICNTVVNWPIVKQMQNKVPTVWWLQEAGVMKHFLNDPAFVSTLRSAKNIVGVSNYSLDMVAPYNSHYSKIYNAVFDFYEPASHDKVPGKRIVFAIVGSIEDRKGHDILFEALSYLQPAELDKLEVNVVGRVLDPAFEKMIRAKLGPSHYVTFTGEVDNAAAVLHVSGADVIVCPSRDDPFPVVLVEGFCMAKTCVVSTATGFAELIRQGETGFVFPSEDAKALANIMSDIVSGKYDLAVIGDHAREVYQQELSIPVLETRLLDYLKSITDPAGTSESQWASKTNKEVLSRI